jgi:hypothetical protein
MRPRWRSCVAAAATISVCGMCHVIGPAGAATVYQLQATSTVPDNVGGFTITFIDNDMDVPTPLLGSDDTITYFSGMYDWRFGLMFDQIVTIPAYNDALDGTGSTWSFHDSLYGQTSETLADYWSYTITAQTPPTVPLPAALPLFATGVGAMGLLGWRRKRKPAA